MNEIRSPKGFIPQCMSALCLTAVFQFAACAQAAPENGVGTKAEPTQTASDAGNMQPADVKLIEKPTSAFDFTALSNEMLCSPSAFPEFFTAANQRVSIHANAAASIVPKVQIPAAKIEVAVRPNEHKLNQISFTEPDKDSKHAPKTFRASAYAIQGRTRSGAKTEQGVLAADPRVLPLGTVVQVNAGKYSGVYTVHDTGGAIKGNRLDVWVPSVKEARRFGRRSVKLVVLRYPGQNKPVAKK